MKAQKPRGREGILAARFVTFLVLATLLLSPPLTQAVPITIEITGEVTSVEGDVGSVPSTIYAGVNFTGTYTYDSSTSDSDDSPYIGGYVHNSPYGISLFLGGYEFKTTSNHIGKFNISIHNDDPQANLWDYYMVESDEIISSPPVGFSVDHIRWILGDITHTALDSYALPVTPPVLTDWGYNVLRISGSGDLGGLLIEGTVTQAVPEPLTCVLMVIGVLFFRRRRKTIKTQKPRGRKGYLSARFVTFFVFATLLLPAPLAHAVPIIIEITGEVTSITSEYIDPLTDSIHVGNMFTGIYIYDTSTADSDSSHIRGSYVHNSPYGVSISLGGYEFSTSSIHTGGFVVTIEDDIVVNNTYDIYSIESSVNTALPSGFTDYSIEWVLSDSTHSALSSTALPTTAPVLGDWDWYRFDIGGWKYVPEGDYFKGFYIQGVVTEAVVIPEPATLFLTMMGIFLSRRRS